MSKTNVTGFKRIYNAFFYSMNGFKAAFINEAAFRQELLLIPFFHTIAFYFSQNISTLLILLILPYLTIAFELINSAIESVVDRISDEYHELSGRAKDIGSATVFLFLLITPLSHFLVILNYFEIIKF